MANATFGVNILPKNDTVTIGNSNSPWTIISPSLTGTPTAPTPTAGDSSTKIATTEFVDNAIETAPKEYGEIIEFELDNVSNVSGAYSHVSTVTGAKADMTPVGITVGNSEAFQDDVTITFGDGTIMLECDSVAGSSTVKVAAFVVEDLSFDPELTSAEYIQLNNTKLDKATFNNWRPSNSGTNDQILRSNGDGTTRWDSAATTTEINTAVTSWLNTNVPTGTTVVIDRSLTQDNCAANAKTVGDELSGLKSALELTKKDTLIASTDVRNYFYKANCYINYSTKQETEVADHSLYKVPIKKGDVVVLMPTTSDVDWTGIDHGFNNKHALSLEKTDNTYYTFDVGTAGYNYHFEFGYAVIFGTDDYINVCFTVYDGRENLIAVYKNWPGNVLNDTDKISNRNTVYTVSTETAVNSKRLYPATSYGTIRKLTNDVVKALWFQVNKGDVIKWSGIPSGISNYGTYITGAGSYVSITDSVYEVPNDGLICTYDETENPHGYCVVYPADSIKISSSQIVDGLNNNQYTGLNCVAFGTSLTYRDVGYRPYLANILGMTIDNQGDGSACWLNSGTEDNIYYNVTNYASFSDKDVCIIEGCVNDWGLNKPLGTYKDTGLDTVCGVLYNMISHVYTQKASIQIFVILDHFGKVNGSTDTSSSAVNASNKTQYDFYEELAKLCEFYGIPCIKEYAISSIGIFGTEYLTDNIHLTALGGQQSAQVIATEMVRIPVKKHS